MTQPNNGPWGPSPRRPRRRRASGRVLALVLGALAIGGLIVFLMWRFPGTLGEEGNRADLILMVGWLALIGSAFIHRDIRARDVLRAISFWLGLGLVLIIGYSYRHDARDLFARVGSELSPASGSAVDGGAMSFAASRDGHFYVDAMVRPNSVAASTRVRFMVDTGATRVVLSPADARRLGYDLEKLSFNQRSNTANGVVFGAPVRLAELVTGQIRVDDLPATVNGAAMGTSLLGMAFLERLRRYHVEKDRMTFYP